MEQPEGPRSGLAGGFVAVTVIAWVVLGLSAFFCVWVTKVGLEFAHEETCGPSPPVAWRQEVVFIGLAVWALLALPALGLMVFRKRTPTVVALILACISGVVPFFTLLIPLFAAGLC